MKLRVTVHGVAYEVDVEILEDDGMLSPASPVVKPQVVHVPVAGQPQSSPAPAAVNPSVTAGASGAGVVAPIAGTVKEIKVSAGQDVQLNDVVIIIEAMKMNTEISATSAGKVKKVNVSVGDSVREGQSLIEFE